MGLNSLIETKKKILNINSRSTETQIAKEQRKNSLKFEDKHKRMTTYVENDIHEVIVYLKSIGQIKTMVEFVNSAFREELRKYSD